MAGVGKSAATLRIIGDDLIPEEITQLLGCAPTRAEQKGQPIHISSGGERTVRTGGWRLEAPDCEPENLDQQVAWLLDRLTNDLSVWRNLTRQYRVDLFCGLFMYTGDEGLTLSPATLAALGERGVELGLCLYPPIAQGAEGSS
jgi:hypothetical protein